MDQLSGIIEFIVATKHRYNHKENEKATTYFNQSHKKQLKATKTKKKILAVKEEMKIAGIFSILLLLSIGPCSVCHVSWKLNYPI